jgi:hypothetical protein
MRYSSTSGGAGTMAAKVVAGSVPMATATSRREPLRLPRATCGRPPMGPSGMATEPPADSAMATTLAVSGFFGGVWLRRRCAAHCGSARRRPFGAASACRWFGRRRPASYTCRCCACRCGGSRVTTQGQGDEASAVVRPALEDGKVVQF